MKKKITTTKKVVKKSRVEKPYNCNTMSVSAFWGMIRNTLRNSSRWWKPIAKCKQAAKRAYKGPNKRQKVEYQCNICKEWFSDKNVEVDHIIECGSLKCPEDLPGFVTRMFVEEDGLQLLCKSCHKNKHKK